MTQGVDRLRHAVHGRPWAWAGLSPPRPAPRGHRPPPSRRCAGRPGALALPPPTPRQLRADPATGGTGVPPPRSLAWRAPALAAPAPSWLPGPPVPGACPAPVPPPAHPAPDSPVRPVQRVAEGRWPWTGTASPRGPACGQGPRRRLPLPPRPPRPPSLPPRGDASCRRTPLPWAPWVGAASRFRQRPGDTARSCPRASSRRGRMARHAPLLGTAVAASLPSSCRSAAPSGDGGG